MEGFTAKGAKNSAQDATNAAARSKDLTIRAARRYNPCMRHQLAIAALCAAVCWCASLGPDAWRVPGGGERPWERGGFSSSALLVPQRSQLSRRPDFRCLASVPASFNSPISAAFPARFFTRFRPPFSARDVSIVPLSSRLLLRSSSDTTDIRPLFGYCYSTVDAIRRMTTTAA